MSGQRFVHRKMGLTVVLTFVLATVVNAYTTQALAHFPWFCLHGNADANTGTVWVEFQYCRYKHSFFINPPSDSDYTVRFNKSLCLNANTEGVTFAECTEGALGQQWMFNRSLGAAKNGTGADMPDTGKLMQRMDPSMNGPHVCLQAPSPFQVGARATIQGCGKEIMQDWMFSLPPPLNTLRLWLPENRQCGAPSGSPPLPNWAPLQTCCLGISGVNEHGTPHSEVCEEGLASQLWVHDGNLIHPATSSALCLASKSGGTFIVACDDDDDKYHRTWSIDESNGLMKQRISGSDFCLCCPDTDYCTTQGHGCTTFAWNTTAIEVDETTAAKKRVDGSGTPSKAQKGQIAAVPQEDKKEAQPQPTHGPPESDKVAHEQPTEEGSI